MSEFDLNKMNEALYRLKNSPKAQHTAEAAFDQMHRFSNDHLHVQGVSATAQKSEVLSMLIDDMSTEILSNQD
ncbi:hypothetical protein ERJ76_26265 [Vibrio anguillarum]|uniref:Uncharacterized protein n=2 Tax=Vibrio anguillarum TaxID=55601 RepID=A0ABR9Z7R6_VIBAN|nr:hypothetical protein [Vibrio anguillarum]MBF4374505.1 hypothetical protein [Vibrio anguillarum]MBF4449112.1 hypothetical protein [Vibrio anguillarum]